MPPTYGRSTAFRRDLEARVAAHFSDCQRDRHGCVRMYLKTAVLLCWLAASYAALVWGATTWWQAVPLAASLALAMAGVGFNVQHDGNHGAYSRRAGVNKAAGLTLNLLGGDAYFWRYKHNIAHHTHTNVAGSDDDIRLGPLARLSPRQPRFWFHRFQHYYVWGLYALLALNWQLTGDFRSFVAPGVGDTRVSRPRGWDLFCFWAGKIGFVLLAFVLPLRHHHLAAVLEVYVLSMMMLGLTLATVFQLAHCVEEAHFPCPDQQTGRIDRDWTAHQLDTTVDFARGNRLLTWYLGGLNYQVEHHLFPKTCHTHYAAISPIVQEACRAHGVAHRSNPTMVHALRSHVRWLKRMGRAPDANQPA